MKILITGATGTVGSELVKLLSAQGEDVRAAVHNPAKAEKIRSTQTETVPMDFSDAGSIEAALKGVDKLFSLSPLAPGMVEQATRLTDAAKKAGVKHIVRLSGKGADAEPGIQLGRWHRSVEKHIESSGVPFTFLRPNNFMQNFANQPPVGGVYYLPLGEGRISYVDARDVAAVAAKTLTGRGHENRTYTLTGREALTVGEAAALISAATGKVVSYIDVPEEAARKGMREHHLPEWLVNALLELHAIGKAGYASDISTDVEKITGGEPTAFRRFADDYASRF